MLRSGIIRGAVGNEYCRYEQSSYAYSINEENKSLTKEWSYGSDYNYNVLHLGEFSQNENKRLLIRAHQDIWSFIIHKMI